MDLFFHFSFLLNHMFQPNAYEKTKYYNKLNLTSRRQSLLEFPKRPPKHTEIDMQHHRVEVHTDTEKKKKKKKINGCYWRTEIALIHGD